MEPNSLQILSVLSQIFIGIAVLYSGNRIAKAQYTKSIQDSWSNWNSLALSDKIIREITLEMLDNPLSSEKAGKRIYVVFSLLNILQASFLGSSSGLLSKRYMKETMKDILVPLLKDEEIYFQITTGGYHPKFKSFCKKLRNEVV